MMSSENTLIEVCMMGLCPEICVDIKLTKYHKRKKYTETLAGGKAQQPSEKNFCSDN